MAITTLEPTTASIFLQSENTGRLPVRDKAPSIAQISTYPPTLCGLGSFTRSLHGHLVTAGAHARVVRVLRDDDEPVRLEAVGARHVVHEWGDGTMVSTARAAHAASQYDTVILQHEFGIFPGDDGERVLDLAEAITSPLITVMHTVVTTPTSNQRRIVERLADRSAGTVVMSYSGYERLVDGYNIDPDRVQVIPHGAIDNRAPRASTPPNPVVLSWGLLGPGKGLEWAIRAMATLSDLTPMPHLAIVGQTHPAITRRDGNSYARMLADLRTELGDSVSVSFDDRYLDGAALRRLVQGADIIVLPYDNSDQVTSGVLIEAIAAGKPVVATEFPHARELLASGAGITVPPRDPEAMGDAVRRILTEPGLARSMSTEAARLAPLFLWTTVAQKYLDLAADVLAIPCGEVFA